MNDKELHADASRVGKSANRPQPGTQADEPSWHHYKVSDEVLAMTFQNRIDIPEDYKEEYYQAMKGRGL